jgi:hypothetical protein
MIKITRSTTCADLRLEGAAKCDGCCQRGDKSELGKKARRFKCKRYFTEKHNSRNNSKRGKTQGQAGYERAWVQLRKLGHCNSTEIEEQPQNVETPSETQGNRKKQKKQPMASLKTIKAKSRRQMVEDFVNESIKTDVIALIEKLLVAIGVSYEPDVMFDLTSVADSPPPPKADPTDTASAVQALCELVEGAPQNPIEIDCPAPESCIDDTDVVEAPQNPIEFDCPAPESRIDDTDVAEAAQILFAASQRKKMDSNKILRTVRLKNGHCIHSVP